jgi:hypothetical protein
MALKARSKTEVAIPTAVADYSLDANMSNVLGAFVGFRFASDPPVSSQRWNDAVAAAGLPESYNHPGMTADVLFCGEFGSLQVKYLNGGKRSLATLPLTKTDTTIAATFVHGNASGERAEAEPVCTIRFDHAAADMPLMVLDGDAWHQCYSRSATDLDATHIAPSLSETDRRVLTETIRSHIDATYRYIGNLTDRQFYERMMLARGESQATIITRGMFFVPHTQDAGTESPLRYFLRFREALRDAAPQCVLSCMPAFPSPDTLQILEAPVRESLESKVAKTCERLDRIDKMIPKGLAQLVTEFDALRTETQTYELLLQIQLDELRSKLATGAELVANKLSTLVQ